MVVSIDDQMAYVYRNGISIGQSPVGLFFDPGEKPPEGVFLMLEGKEPADATLPGTIIHPWTVLSLTGGTAQTDAVTRSSHALGFLPF